MVGNLDVELIGDMDKQAFLSDHDGEHVLRLLVVDCLVVEHVGC